MRNIQLTKDPQQDGSIHHNPSTGCPLEPCVKVLVSGEMPDVCECLHNNGVDENNELVWQCSKTPCRSGA